MSSIPGYNLEAFLIWLLDIRVIGEAEANFSVGVAGMFSGEDSRPILTLDQFSPIVALYEPYREMVEDRLLDFDEDTQSWRSYAEHVDTDVPERVGDQAIEMVKLYKVADKVHINISE